MSRYWIRTTDLAEAVIIARMRWKQDILFFVGALLLAACASTTPTISNTTPVAAAEVSGYRTQTADSGAVHIFRDEGFAGSAVRYRLFVDNQQVATIAVSERVTLHLPAGDHFLEVKAPGPQFLVTPGESRIVTIKAGSDSYFRITSDGSSIRVQPVSPSAVGVQ